MSEINLSINSNGSHYLQLDEKENEEETPRYSETDKKHDDYELASYKYSVGGDEFDRTPDWIKNKKHKDPWAVSHSWMRPTVTLVLYTLLCTITYLILEFSSDLDETNVFCREPLVAWSRGYFTDCFREALFSLPNVLSLLTASFIWFVGGPWRDVKGYHGTRPVTSFFLVKIICCVLCMLLPLARLMVRAFTFHYTAGDTPVVFSASDVAQSICFGIVTGTVVHDWRKGYGHAMYIRYFWWAGAVDSLLKLYSVFKYLDQETLGTDLLYALSGLCTFVLAIQGAMGWKHGRLEVYGSGRGRQVKRRGFPPLWQVWDLMRDDRVMLVVGLLLSASQGFLLSSALTATASLMGGDVDSKEEASNQLGVFLMLSSAVAVSTAIQQAIFGITGQRVKRRMKDRMFKNFLLQDASFLHKKENDTGRLTSRLLTDTERFGTAMTTQLSSVMRPVSQAVIGLIFLFRLSWRLTAVFLMMECIVLCISVVRSNLITVKYSRLYSDELSKVSSKGVESIKGIECIHQYLQERNEHQAFKQVLDSVYTVGVNKEVRESMFEGLEHLLLAAVLGTGLWYGAVLVADKGSDEFDRSDLTAYALIAGAVIQSMESIMKIVPEFLDISGPALRVCELINSKVTWDFDQPDKGIVPQKLEGRIGFEDVLFYYPGSDNKTLGPGLSFLIKGGESVALVGESGCGKSTCISLVQRQYHIQGLQQGCKPLDKGTLSLDGHDVRALSKRWLEERIGVVAQRPVIWNTTILENVAYGSAAERWIPADSMEKQAQRQRVIEALKGAAAWDEFVNPTPPLRPDGTPGTPGLGLDFAVGEDGCNLSGGQKQRVSIARMLYKNPSLLVFDEVTSALDAGSEKNVMKTLIDISERPSKKTCLMIAHRLNTIKHADHIIVLSKNGNIIEETRGHWEDEKGQTIDERGRPVAVPSQQSRVRGKAEDSTGWQSIPSPEVPPPLPDGSRPPVVATAEYEDEDGHSVPASVRAGPYRFVTAHEQLLRNRQGYYKKMWDNQTF